MSKFAVVTAALVAIMTASICGVQAFARQQPNLAMRLLGAAVIKPEQEVCWQGICPGERLSDEVKNILADHHIRAAIEPHYRVTERGFDPNYPVCVVLQTDWHICFTYDEPNKSTRSIVVNNLGHDLRLGDIVNGFGSPKAVGICITFLYDKQQRQDRFQTQAYFMYGANVVVSAHRALAYPSLAAIPRGEWHSDATMIVDNIEYYPLGQPISTDMNRFSDWHGFSLGNALAERLTCVT